MADITKEVDNYIRLGLLLTGVSPRGVRTFFDQQFPPPSLQTTIDMNSKQNMPLDKLFRVKKVLNKRQWNMLHPNTAVPTITLKQSSYSVTAGGTVTLDCTVSSPQQDVTSVQWQRNVNGVITTINSTTDAKKYSGSIPTTPSLTIFNAGCGDVGTYTCFANNDIVTGQSSATTLSVTGTVPTVTIQQPSYSVAPGDSVTLVCFVSSNLPVTSIQWMRNVNGVVTTFTSNPDTNNNGGSTTTPHTLTICNAVSSDVGNYTCYASNSVGTGQSTTSTLSVTGPVPTVTMQQTSYSVTPGGPVTLECTVASTLPITDVQWQRNAGGSITTITSTTNPNEYSGSTPTTPSLTILNVASSDVGTYTCYASNRFGTGQSTTTTLSVTQISANSKTFDITLMIVLIRNLTRLPPPNRGFDRLPSLGDTTACADLARIKYYRNNFAHLKDNKVDNSTFKKAWIEISEAIGRLGGPAMLKECQELETKPLDPSYKEIMTEIDKLKLEVQEEIIPDIKSVKGSMESLKLLYDELQCGQDAIQDDVKRLKTSHKDTVPWNIREHIKATLERWKKSDEKFIDTRASDYILKCMNTKNCVAVTGNSGVGKTVTVRHVALKMVEEGYDVLPIIDPSDILKYDNSNHKMLYVFDDLCGKYTLNQSSFDRWSEQLHSIEPLLERIKIIFSCRLQVYTDEKFESLDLLKSYECNLSSKELCLLETEKDSIAKMYLKEKASSIKPYSEKFDFFPLLCHLCDENPELNVVDFFQNPFSVYESELDKLKLNAYTKYCCLALCVMFNNSLREEWLTEEAGTDVDTVIQNTCDVCKLNRGTSKLVLKDGLDSLLHTFLKKENNVYSTLHDKLFDFLSYYFGKTMITCLIKNASCRFIRERFLLERHVDSDQYITIVPDEYKEMYIKRMVHDWSTGEVVSVFGNINMKIPNFRKMFLTDITKKEISYQRQLAHTLDRTTNATVLIQCCLNGGIDFIHWCLVVMMVCHLCMLHVKMVTLK